MSSFVFLMYSMCIIQMIQCIIFYTLSSRSPLLHDYEKKHEDLAVLIAFGRYIDWLFRLIA